MPAGAVALAIGADMPPLPPEAYGFSVYAGNYDYPLQGTLNSGFPYAVNRDATMAAALTTQQMTDFWYFAQTAKISVQASVVQEVHYNYLTVYQDWDTTHICGTSGEGDKGAPVYPAVYPTFSFQRGYMIYTSPQGYANPDGTIMTPPTLADDYPTYLYAYDSGVLSPRTATPGGLDRVEISQATLWDRRVPLSGSNSARVCGWGTAAQFTDAIALSTILGASWDGVGCYPASSSTAKQRTPVFDLGPSAAPSDDGNRLTQISSGAWWMPIGPSLLGPDVTVFTQATKVALASITGWVYATAATLPDTTYYNYRPIYTFSGWADPSASSIVYPSGVTLPTPQYGTQRQAIVVFSSQAAYKRYCASYAHDGLVATGSATLNWHGSSPFSVTLPYVADGQLGLIYTASQTWANIAPGPSGPRFCAPTIAIDIWPS